jgi:DNA-binding NtrC family response regulator
MNPRNPASSILVIDDDESIRGVVEICLRHAGHTVVSTTGRAQVLAWLNRQPFDLVVTDMRMPDLDGIEVISLVKAHQPGAAILAMSGGGSYMKSEFCAVLETMLGAGVPLMKPFHLAELLLAVDQALESRGFESANARNSSGHFTPITS